MDQKLKTIAELLKQFVGSDKDVRQAALAALSQETRHQILQHVNEFQGELENSTTVKGVDSDAISVGSDCVIVDDALSSKSPIEWTTADFGEVLNNGRRLYLEHMRKRGLAWNSMLEYDSLEGCKTSLQPTSEGRSQPPSSQGRQISGFAERLKSYEEYYAAALA